MTAMPGRVVAWVRFSDLSDGGREFYVRNTNLDHVSQYARERSADLLSETNARFDRSLPVVVTGDFNAAAHDNPVYCRFPATTTPSGTPSGTSTPP